MKARKLYVGGSERKDEKSSRKAFFWTTVQTEILLDFEGKAGFDPSKQVNVVFQN